MPMLDSRKFNELSYDEQIQMVAHAGLESLYFFNKHILKYPDIDINVHGEWEKFLKENKDRKKLLLVPRGHFKTTFVTVGGTLQNIVANPSSRILIANAIGDNAISFLSEIKQHIRENENLHFYYPEVKDWYKKAGKWTEKSIRIPRERKSKEPTIETSGMGGSLVSQHYDKIILDDLVNVENSATRVQANKVVDYYKHCISLLEPGGELIVIGTRYTYYELYQHILDNLSDEFAIFVRTAYKKRLELKKRRKNGTSCQKTVHYIPEKHEYKKGTLKPYFPAKFSLESLESIRRNQGSYVFSCQYLNSPIDEESAVFKKSWIHYYDIIPKETMYIVISVDPAVSKERHGDYSAIVTTGISENGKKYILDIRRNKWNPFELIDESFRAYDTWKANVFIVESASFQKSLQYYFHEEMKKRDKFLPLFEAKADTRVTKEMKIKGLQPYYERGEIFQRKEMADLEEELIKFPVCKTDDIIDALANQIRFWQAPEQIQGIEDNSQSLEPASYEEKVAKDMSELEENTPDLESNPDAPPADDVLGNDY